MLATPAPRPLATDLARALGRLRRSLNRAVRAATGTTALPEAQLELLRLVERHPGIRVREAAVELRLAPNTVSTLVRHLSDAGLLDRGADLEDRRVARLRLTSAAGERLRRWRDRRHEILAARLAALAENDRHSLAEALPVLDQVAQSLELGWPPALDGEPAARFSLHGA
jgi:DNA-binding MarR family transcriptional regulator